MAPTPPPAPDIDVIRDLLDRLTRLEVTVREARGRLVIRGKPGYERDNTVQSLAARLQGHYAASPEEVGEVLREREQSA